MTLHDAAIALVSGASGMIAGAVHFALLRRTVNAIAMPDASGWQFVAPCLRFALTGAVLSFAAVYGGLTLIAAFAGFLAARAVALGMVGSGSP